MSHFSLNRFFLSLSLSSAARLFLRRSSNHFFSNIIIILYTFPFALLSASLTVLYFVRSQAKRNRSGRLRQNKKGPGRKLALIIHEFRVPPSLRSRPVCHSSLSLFCQTTLLIHTETDNIRSIDKTKRNETRVTSRYN